MHTKVTGLLAIILFRDVCHVLMIDILYITVKFITAISSQVQIANAPPN